jgi:phosphatidylinositol alpha-mannosyltransferase
LRILLVNPYDLTHPGGVTSHVLDLAHQFHAMEHEVAIAGPAGHGMLPQNGYTHHLGPTFRALSPGDAARVNINPFIGRDIQEFLSKRRFDVIHLHEPFLPFIGPAFLRLSNAVKVGTFHTWRQGPHLPYILGWPLLQYWNRKLHGHIAVSEMSRKTIGAYVKAKYRVIPNGVDFHRFADPAPPPPHLSDARPTLLFVGRIEARKGIPYLLEAYKTVKESIPTARLVIVGEGGLLRDYKDMCRRLDLMDVYFEGYVSPDKLPGYYQRADVFCSPSTVNEAFGITLLEAMAAGTPVVATTTNGPATLGPDGVNGLIVPPKDADALATAAIRLLEDRPLAAKMAASAHERARLFDWENVALQLLDYYQEVGAANR